MILFREKLTPGIPTILAVLLIIPANLIVFAPLNLWFGVIIGLGTTGIVITILFRTSPEIVVTDTHFSAGKARIERKYISHVASHRGEEARKAKGQDLDARAWRVFRGWIEPVVVVNIRDNNDPVPYWIISSTKPETLAAALTPRDGENYAAHS